MRAIVLSTVVAVTLLGGGDAQSMSASSHDTAHVETTEVRFVRPGGGGKLRGLSTPRPKLALKPGARSGITGPKRPRIPRPWPPKPKKPTKPDKPGKGDPPPSRPYKLPGPKFKPPGI